MVRNWTQNRTFDELFDTLLDYKYVGSIAGRIHQNLATEWISNR